MAAAGGRGRAKRVRDRGEGVRQKGGVGGGLAWLPSFFFAPRRHVRAEGNYGLVGRRAPRRDPPRPFSMEEREMEGVWARRIRHFNNTDPLRAWRAAGRRLFSGRLSRRGADFSVGGVRSSLAAPSFLDLPQPPFSSPLLRVSSPSARPFRRRKRHVFRKLSRLLIVGPVGFIWSFGRVGFGSPGSRLRPWAAPPPPHLLLWPPPPPLLPY
jgi:hypothetical protein